MTMANLLCCIHFPLDTETDTIQHKTVSQTVMNNSRKTQALFFFV